LLKVKQAKFIISCAKTDQIPETGFPEFAFIGRSNVGKSSLINTLCGTTKLVKVAKRPGTTQLLNYFEINESFYFVDLPGYGYAKAPKLEKVKWSKNINQYLRFSENLKLMFVLIDSRHGIKDVDWLMIEFLQKENIPFCLVATKRDKLSGNEWTKQKKLIQKQVGTDDLKIISFSSLKKIGIAEVMDVMENILVLDNTN